MQVFGLRSPDNSTPALYLRIAALVLISAASFLVSPDLHAQRVKSSTKSGEQRKAEKGLKDNRYFIYFLNSTVTNYGTEKQQTLFRETIQRDIFSQFLYMKYLFYESFMEIRKCQKNLINMYKEFLTQDIVMTKHELDTFAPKVISSKDPLARLYLRLGYRETVSTSIEMGMADHYRETLYSMRLYKYVKAVKRVKEAKKYAFLAYMRASQTNDERQSKKVLSFDEINKKMSSLLPADEADRITTMNYDAYYRSKKPKSFYDTVWENPDLESLEDFKLYLKTKE